MIVLVGVDSSDTALMAAQRAATIAEAFSGELHVVTAFTVNLDETIKSVQRPSKPDNYRNLIARHEKRAENTAYAVAEKLCQDHPALKIAAGAVEGQPGTALTRKARTLGAGLIVVGNKRVQGPTRVFGSIARSVASEADCDLYIVNTHGS